jgi:hypothetical protein
MEVDGKVSIPNMHYIIKHLNLQIVINDQCEQAVESQKTDGSTCIKVWSYYHGKLAY